MTTYPRIGQIIFDKERKTAHSKHIQLKLTKISTFAMRNPDILENVLE